MASESRIIIDPKELPATSSKTDSSSDDTRVHPSFSSEDADIVLCSQDGVAFRVYSQVLKLNSGWFRTLFTLPQNHTNNSDASSSADPIQTTETSDVLVALLSISSGLEMPKFDSIEFVEAVIHAAEKYDMPGVLSIVRLAIMTPAILEKHPIRVYAIACKWGWIEEAKVASSHTLTLDLLSPPTIHELKVVDSVDLTRLMLLHRRRREELRKNLDSTELFYANTVPGSCSGCSVDVIHDRWHRLKYRWTSESETKPVDIATKDILERLDLLNVLESECTRCRKKLYNAESTITNLRQILNELPRTVVFEN